MNVKRSHQNLLALKKKKLITKCFTSIDSARAAHTAFLVNAFISQYWKKHNSNKTYQGLPGGHGQKVVSDFVMLISCFCGWICDRIVLDMLCVTTFLSGLILRSQWRGEWWRCHSFSSSSLTSLPQEPAMTSSTSPSGTLVGWKLSIGCCHRILCDICWCRCFGSFYSVIANTSSLFFFSYFWSL